MNMIALVDDYGGLGAKGNLLYKIKEDMMYFKQRTENKVVVMGRNTFDSLPNGALPKRTNIVLTSDNSFSPENVIVVHSYQDLFKELEKYPTDDVFIIGGASLYSELMDRCDVIYINRLHRAEYAGYEIDAFFPHFDFDKTIDRGWDLSDRRDMGVQYQVTSTKQKGFGTLSFMVFRKHELIKDTLQEAHKPVLMPAT